MKTLVGIWAREFLRKDERDALHQALEAILIPDSEDRLPVIPMENGEVREYWLESGFRVAL